MGKIIFSPKSSDLQILTTAKSSNSLACDQTFIVKNIEFYIYLDIHELRI